MSKLKCISGPRLALTAASVAAMLSEHFDKDDINILSSFFNAIGDSLGIIAAREAACSSSEDKGQTNVNNKLS